MISYDESMNTIFQNEQMDALIRFWNNSEGIAETRYSDSRGSNAQNPSDSLQLSNKTMKGRKEREQ